MANAQPPASFDRLKGIAKDMSQLIGQTPMVYLSPKLNTTKATIALKLESENPMASVKDRLGLAMIEDLEQRGLITPGKSTLVEATSGNTGIALAHVGAIRGYKVILTMPETMSTERRCLLKVLGATCVVTPAAKGIKGARAMADKIVKETEGAILTEQFETPANARIHRATTGPEIWAQTQGKIDIFVSGVGTGGTVTGVAQYFKQDRKASVKIVAIEPKESSVISGGAPGPHKIAGIGAGFIPNVLDKTLLDETFTVHSDEALAMARRLPHTEGVFCGISGGAAVHAAIEIAKRPENEGKLIVAVIPSFGERYLSTALFNDIREEAIKWPVVDPAA